MSIETKSIVQGGSLQLLTTLGKYPPEPAGHTGPYPLQPTALHSLLIYLPVP